MREGLVNMDDTDVDYITSLSHTYDFKPGFAFMIYGFHIH